MVNIKAKIISNLPISCGHFKLILEAPAIAQGARPGQFVHVRVEEGMNPLLRRPFSIHRVRTANPQNPEARGDQIEILYKVRGKGTEILSQKRPSELLEIMGPLGNGFPLPLVEKENTCILVAGGVGVAPLVFLAYVLLNTYKTKTKVLIGAKTKDTLLCVDEFRQLGCEVEIATEDGSAGFKGLVTDLLKQFLSGKSLPFNPILYSAGPNFMLQEIKKIANIFKILCFGSLEENIACGLGGCLGCVVKTTQGYKRVCKEGPVFNLEEILWEP